MIKYLPTILYALVCMLNLAILYVKSGESAALTGTIAVAMAISGSFSAARAMREL